MSEQLIKAGNYNLEMMQKMKIIKKTLEFRHLETSFPKALGRKKKVRKKRSLSKEGVQIEPMPTLTPHPLSREGVCFTGAITREVQTGAG